MISSEMAVIFISAAKDSVADRAFNVGAVGFLQKPFNGQSLVDLINAASDNNSGQNQKQE